jgi:hypothetical protein
MATSRVENSARVWSCQPKSARAAALLQDFNFSFKPKISEPNFSTFFGVVSMHESSWENRQLLKVDYGLQMGPRVDCMTHKKSPNSDQPQRLCANLVKHLSFIDATAK